MITHVTGGVPDFSGLPHTGDCLMAMEPGRDWGLYMVTGSQAQLDAINALSQVYLLCGVSVPDFDSWAELELVINSTGRSQLNTWLSNHSKPTIPADWIYRQVYGMLLRYYRDNDSDLLEHTLANAFRTATNTILTAHGQPNVPSVWTYYQLSQAIVNRLQGHWPELGDDMDEALRTRINTWLTAHGYPNIPDTWTNRRVINEMCQRWNPNHRQIEENDVLE